VGAEDPAMRLPILFVLVGLLGGCAAGASTPLMTEERAAAATDSQPLSHSSIRRRGWSMTSGPAATWTNTRHTATAVRAPSHP